MSHELRTPLHTIIGFSELLVEGLEGELNATQRRFVEHIHRDSLHLLELINDILDLSKIEAGRLELRCAAFPLEDALQEVLATVRPQAAAKSQRLRVTVPEPLILDADRVRFKEILYNLLSNAVKFTGEGGTISVAVARDSRFARVVVEDTGIGIAEEQQDVVFDAFRQVGSTTKGIREGTGLGLAITRRLVDQHGGRLWLESELGRGSCFTFTLPLDVPGNA
jgi:signal transduction histidine kinase